MGFSLPGDKLERRRFRIEHLRKKLDKDPELKEKLRKRFEKREARERLKYQMDYNRAEERAHFGPKQPSEMEDLWGLSILPILSLVIIGANFFCII